MWIFSLFRFIPWAIRLMGVTTIMPFLPMLKKYWREVLILLLLATIGFGGWYYSASKSNLKQELVVTNIALDTSESNEKILRAEIDKNMSDMMILKTRNGQLELSVSEAQNKIDEIEANPQIVYRDVYKTVLPKECNQKFEWMKNQALDIKKNMK